MKGVGVKSVVFLGGPQVISAGNALIRLAVAQSDPEYLNYVEGVRPMRHTNDMSAPAKFTSLRESNPGLSSEANGWDPSLYSAGSSKKCLGNAQRETHGMQLSRPVIEEMVARSAQARQQSPV